jgi:hypothetical protein
MSEDKIAYQCSHGADVEGEAQCTEVFESEPLGPADRLCKKHRPKGKDDDDDQPKARATEHKASEHGHQAAAHPAKGK